MVAYSFRPRFCLPIVEGTKGGTIRAERRGHGHAMFGDELQLYTGMRTRSCKLILRTRCIALSPIRLDFAEELVETYYEKPLRFHGARLLDAFARFDGFDNWDDLKNFWHAENGASENFAGWHIRWMPLPSEVA